MAEFRFYTIWEDSVQYLRMLAELRRFTFIVDMWYKEPNPVKFRTLTDQLESVVKDQVRLYLWSDEYSHFPMDFGTPTSTGLLMIDPTKSGPVLDLILPSGHTVKGKRTVGLGSISYQPRYEEPQTGHLYSPPESLKQVYAEVRRLLQRNMVKRYFRSRSITERGFRPTIEACWLGRHAAELLETGEGGILIGPEENWKKGSDLKKSRKELEPLVTGDE